MSCVAEFGIIEEIEKDKDYSVYEPENYHCVCINDDYLDDWWKSLAQIKTYFHNFKREEFALARWGVTIIPPDSLEQFYNIVLSDKRFEFEKELIDLAELLKRAIKENKYVIHFGI